MRGPCCMHSVRRVEPSIWKRKKNSCQWWASSFNFSYKWAYFQKLWRRKPVTCGVRFLSTSQLLVLVELSVLHVVPAVHEKETAVKGRRLLACGSYFPSLCETRIKSVKLNGWCQLHPWKKKSWPESVDFNVQPQQDLLEALFLPVLYLYSSPAVVGHIKVPPPMRVYWQPRSHTVL